MSTSQPASPSLLPHLEALHAGHHDEVGIARGIAPLDLHDRRPVLQTNLGQLHLQVTYTALGEQDHRVLQESTVEQKEQLVIRRRTPSATQTQHTDPPPRTQSKEVTGACMVVGGVWREGGGLAGLAGATRASSQRRTLIQSQPGSQPLKTWLTKPPTCELAATPPSPLLPPPPTSSRHECMSNHVLANARAQLRTGSGVAHTGSPCVRRPAANRGMDGGKTCVAHAKQSPRRPTRHAASEPVQANEIHVTTHAAVPLGAG